MSNPWAKNPAALDVKEKRRQFIDVDNLSSMGLGFLNLALRLNGWYVTSFFMQLGNRKDR